MARGLKKLETVVARLLSPSGCPWDRAQTHKTLVPYLREESKELADAIKGGRWHEIEDELGDLLFHIFFHSKIAEKAGNFSMDDVAESQASPRVRAHPQVQDGEGRPPALGRDQGGRARDAGEGSRRPHLAQEEALTARGELPLRHEERKRKGNGETLSFPNIRS
jgi:NTP pyrophosphatase (non-canonical NTP hydrolase)